MSNTNLPVVFNVTVKTNESSKGCSSDRHLKIQTQSGNTLLRALEAYANSNPDFSFKSMDDPRCGTFLAAVVGVSNGCDKFWTTALYNSTPKDARPIGLDFEVRNGDTIGLLYIHY